MIASILFKPHYLANEPPFGALYKFNECGYFGRIPLRLFNFCQCIAGIHFGTKTDAVNLFEFLNTLFREALALQPYDIDSIDLCLIAVAHGSDERECIARNHGKSSDKRMEADPTELMHG